eukprot:246691_1
MGNKQSKSNTESQRKSANSIPRKLIQLLKQTKINQDDINIAIKIAQESNNITLKNPLVVIILPIYADNTLPLLPNQDANIVIVPYKTHADIMLQVRSIVKQLADKYDTADALIFMLICVISVHRNKPQLYYDQNEKDRHIELLKQDIKNSIKNRLPESHHEIPIIWNYSKCLTFNAKTDAMPSRNHVSSSITNISSIELEQTIKSSVTSVTKTDECETETATVTHGPFHVDKQMYKNEEDDLEREEQKIECSDRSNDSSYVMKSKIRADIEHVAYQQQYSSINISQELSVSIVPQIIKEQITHVYSHMIKSTALQKDACFDTSDGMINIFNYGFHHKKTNQQLYLIAKRYTGNRNFKWKMIDKLFNDSDIRDEFGISTEKLPKLWRLKSQFSKELIIKHKNEIQCVINKHFEDIANKTNWTSVHIYNIKANTKRWTLSLTRKLFAAKLIQSKTSEYNIVPIIMKATNNISDNTHEVEFVQILRIRCKHDVDIGISYIYDPVTNTVKVRGIHLDQAFILSQHQLLLPDHQCSCLKEFSTNADHLLIANPDVHRNNMNRYKTKCNEQTQLIKKKDKIIKVAQMNWKKTTDALLLLRAKAQSVNEKSSSNV